MHIGPEARSIGRYVVDVDSSLRVTEMSYLTARDIIALHGRIDSAAVVIWETNGHSVVLAPGDRIELDDNRVDFFRIVAPSNSVCSMNRAVSAFAIAA
jgi:hypothetical protein